MEKAYSIKKEYKIPKSFIQEEYGILKIIIKVFRIEGNRLVVEKDVNKNKEASNHLLKIIENYLNEAKINANVSGLYNRIFEEIENLVTFKAKEKGTLVDNNIHFQIVI